MSHTVFVHAQSHVVFGKALLDGLRMQVVHLAQTYALTETSAHATALDSTPDTAACTLL